MTAALIVLDVLAGLAVLGLFALGAHARTLTLELAAVRKATEATVLVGQLNAQISARMADVVAPRTPPPTKPDPVTPLRELRTAPGAH